MKPRHFLSITDIDSAEFLQLISRASKLKSLRQAGEDFAPFVRKVLAMIFEKSSTRTRVSFETGMVQLGGSAIFLSPRDTHLGRGEPIEDTARIVSSMVDIIMVRTYAHETIERFAEYASVPVINALTDQSHPCQLLADMQTYAEHRGDIRGKKVAWIGDGNNMCNSYIETAQRLDFQLFIASPDNYLPDPKLCAQFSDHLEIVPDPMLAAKDADLITTDTWASMGQEDEKQKRAEVFSDYQVNNAMMQQAKPDAIFLHCLPAYRGLEVSAEVLDGPQSKVWDQAENRLHAQKALLEFLLTQPASG